MDELERLRTRVDTLEAELRRERAMFAGGPVVVFRWVAVPGWPVEYVSGNVHELFELPDGGWTIDAVQELVDAGFVRSHLDAGRYSLPMVVHEYVAAHLTGEDRRVAEARGEGP